MNHTLALFVITGAAGIAMVLLVLVVDRAQERRRTRTGRQTR